MSAPDSVQEPCRRLRWLLAVVGLCVLLPLDAAEPPKEKMSAAERQAKVKERDRLWAETWKLRAGGKLAEAVAAAEKTLAIERQLVGKTHADVVMLVQSLARLQEEREDFTAAGKRWREVRDIQTARFGKDDWRVTDARLALADLEVRAKLNGKQRQQLAEAERLNRQIIALERKGGIRQAIPLAERALALRKDSLGEKHPDYAGSLNNLAFLYQRMGTYTRAEPLYRQALDIFKQVFDEEHPVYATGLNNLAMLYWDMNDYAKAEPLYRQARDIYKQTLSDKHPHYAQSLNNLAMLYLVQDERAEGLKLAREAWHIIRAHLDLTANVQSERQQLRNNATLRFYLDNFLSAASAAKAPAAEVYAEVLVWKGSVSLRQQQMRRLRRELGNSGPETAQLYADLQAATRRLAALVNTTPRPKQLETYRQRLENANAEVERLQKELASASAAFCKQLEQRRRTPDDLRRALPEGLALVDLLEYSHFTPQAKGRRAWERRLTAFVVRKDRPVASIDLGAVATLAEDVERWRASIRRRTRPAFSPNDPAALLREQLWQPLEPYLKDAATVLISPDGVVTRLPWGALPGATPDKYLLEERNIAVLAVPQFLPELLAAAKTADERAASLLLVGDVDYEAAAGKADVEIASRGLATVLQRGGGASWKRLPGTKKEAAAIHTLYQRCFPTGTTKLLDAGTATEGAVREAAPRYTWLHLATHGYFAPQKVNAALGRDKRRLESRMSLAEQRGFLGFPQGLLAGVVLAGANKGDGEDEDDGVLTALEVAELDLRGVELAVLSACETGLGVKASGEGLLGLQRAFQVAGAHSVAASLWSVPDEATRVLMERFYDNLWRKKMGRLAALREAQLWLLREGQRQPQLRRGLDLVRDEPGDVAARRLPPYYWAAFVLSGDWR